MAQTGSVAEGRLSDWISLGVLASWVPRDAVDEAVEATGKGAKRKGGKLPPHVMVYFAMALALLADEDYEETWVRLSEALADWGCWDPSQATVTTGGLTQARQRLGHEPVKEVFAQVARPVATEDTPGAFLGPWRKMSMDGLEWDIPDTEPNAAAFGYPGTGKDDAPAAFPKARAVTIGECASHAAVLAAIGPCVSKGSGEQSLARQLYPQEIWGYLLTHYAISALICTAATNAGIDPDRVKFKRTVRIIRRRAAGPAFPPGQRQRILDCVMAAITDPQQLNERRERSYPRVVKRARHNHYPVKKPGQHGTRHDARATIKLANPILTSAKVRTAA